MRFACLLLVMSLAALPASAADTEAELDAVREVVDVLVRRSGALEAGAVPGSGYVDEATAKRRFEDHVYEHLVGEHARAAEGFFTLVSTGVLGDEQLQHDAEWYLAESLEDMGNVATALARYQAIADQPDHPFRQEAVRKMLEIYATTGRDEAFAELYEREVLRGRVQPTDVVRYSLGKSFYAQGQLDAAREQFEAVSPDGGWYARARYHLGVIDVVEGHLERSLEPFRVASEQSVETGEDRDVRDLALLAQARVLFELERYADAAALYESVGGDSDYNADTLYELVWTYIKQERWEEALRTAEIFLIAYPEHVNTPQLKLLEGHLRVSKEEYDAALSAYENVIDEYRPVQDYFRGLQREGEPAAYLRQLAGEPAFATLRLPDFAVAKMLEDPDLARSVGVLSELRQEGADIDACEALIRELEPLLRGGDALGEYENLRYDAVLVANQAAEQALLLLEIEENWLYEELPRGRRADVDPLRERRLQLIGLARDSAYRLEEAREAIERHNREVRKVRDEARETIAAADRHLDLILEIRGMLADPNARLKGRMREIVEDDLAYLEGQLGAATRHLEALDQELASIPPPGDSRRIVRSGRPSVDLMEEIEALRHDYSALRPGNRPAPVSERIDGLHHALDAVHQRLQRVTAALADVEVREMEVLRARFDREVTAVEGHRAAHAAYVASTEAVALDLTRDGFGRLADFFGESVLKADMGIVDAYWSQKLATVDEIARIKAEKAQLVEEFERRFGLIEQKLK